MSPGVPGGGMGAEQFDRRINDTSLRVIGICIFFFISNIGVKIQIFNHDRLATISYVLYNASDGVQREGYPPPQ